MRLMAPSWITDVRFTEGVGFEGNDALIVNHLNARRAELEAEEGPMTDEEALVLVRTEFVAVVEIPAEA